MADPIVEVIHAVPDVVDVVMSVDYNSPWATLYWSPPRKLSTTLHDASLWTAVGLENYNGGSVNDGELGGVAFTWLNGSGPSRLTLDLGDGNDEAMRLCRYSYPNPLSVTLIHPTISWSDDDVSYTPIAGGSSQSYLHPSGDASSYVRRWADVGAHRYWRFARNSGSDASIFSEVWFRSHGDEDEEVEGFRVDNAIYQYLLIQPADMPTADLPLIIPAAWKSFVTPDNGKQTSGAATVRTIKTIQGNRTVSEGVSVSATSDEARSRSLSLTTGTNHDVAIQSCPAHYYLIGGAGTKTVTGFMFGDTGDELTFQIPAGYTLVANHDDAGSTSGFRTLTRTGAAISIGAGFARFKKCLSPAGWFLEYGCDSTGFK